MSPDDQVPAVLREACRADVPGIQRVRHSVRENVLTSCVITDAEVIDYLERHGRGWVVVDPGNEVLGFAIGDARDGNIWALFVDPDHEGRGYGRRLHDAMVSWLFSRGLRRLWLGTQPATRAERFYARAGWTDKGLQPDGERRFELEAT
jgi:GNAT superfamily N-acetyltransferase